MEAGTVRIGWTNEYASAEYIVAAATAIVIDPTENFILNGKMGCRKDFQIMMEWRNQIMSTDPTNCGILFSSCF